MKIYISGPITGILDYKERFVKAERELQDKGHIVINPSFMPAGLTISDYLSVDLKMIDCCDAVYLLEGFEKSIGCSAEILHAVLTGKEAFLQKKINIDYINNAYQILTGDNEIFTISAVQMEHAIQTVYPEYCLHSFSEFGGYHKVNMLFNYLGLLDITDSEFLDIMERSRKHFKWLPKFGEQCWVIDDRCKKGMTKAIILNIFDNGKVEVITPDLSTKSIEVDKTKLFRTREDARKEKRRLRNEDL